MAKTRVGSGYLAICTLGKKGGKERWEEKEDNWQPEKIEQREGGDRTLISSFGRRSSVDLLTWDEIKHRSPRLERDGRQSPLNLFIWEEIGTRMGGGWCDFNGFEFWQGFGVEDDS
ncbi:hypothetical protein QYF36_004821 [Acer negundo]|nr:hypothetical protein QYF36_004821 [Acer negundo]